MAGLEISDIPSLPRSYCGDSDLGFFFNKSGSELYSGCRRACLLRWSLRINRFSHQGHTKFFSPETNKIKLILKAQNTTKAEFANTVDPDETAHNEPSYLDLQCLNFQSYTLKVFENFADVILSSALLVLYGLQYD